MSLRCAFFASRLGYKSDAVGVLRSICGFFFLEIRCMTCALSEVGNLGFWVGEINVRGNESNNAFTDLREKPPSMPLE